MRLDEKVDAEAGADKTRGMIVMKRLFPSLGLGALLSCGSGCVMKRTVTDGGSVVSENYVVKRPIRDAIVAEEGKTP